MPGVPAVILNDIAGCDHITLKCSGRRIYAHRGILGLSLTAADEEERNDLYDGYTGYAFIADDVPEGEEAITAEEKREIAERMVARWKEWGGL